MQILFIILIVLAVILGMETLRLRNSSATIATQARDLLYSYTKKGAIQKYLLEKQVKIVKYGISYKHGKEVTLQQYYIYKLMMAIVFGMLALVLRIPFPVLPWPIVFVGIIFGWFLEDIHLYFFNNSQNQEMMKDIQEMIRSFVYSQKGGQFLYGSVRTASLVVEHTRLKDALIELYAKFQTNEETMKALDEFEIKFDNIYITAFAITLKQMLQSGKSDEMLMALQKNISDMETAINITKKDKLDNKQTFYSLLIFGVAIIVIMYAFVSTVDVSLFFFE